ncbi:SWIM zinc finger family protein [Gorillibacterium massiliense]|uniref:SWIM zinc finger family protein n=1 Tax=Gorillibacterium massiliense TaxID=1280390 RepID=UPI0005941170|nr:SWIM zinc finger family protein [Gorillibacterium massiliense]
MAQIKLPLNRIRFLSDAMEKHMNTVILSRGWNYYHRGLVGDLELTHHELRATVHGTTPYDVTLNLENTEESFCTCPYETWCKHMAAVLFKAYAPHGRPELLFVNMQKNLNTKSKLRNTSRAKKASAPAQANLSAESPETWHDFFESRFTGYILSHQQSVETFYRTARETLEPLAASWDPSLRLLFRIHVLFFILRRIDRFHRESRASYLTYYFEAAGRTVYARCQSTLVELIGEDTAKKAVGKHPKIWRETTRLLRDYLLDERPGVTDWLDLYRLFWWALGTPHSSETAWEKDQLAAYLDGRATTGNEPAPGKTRRHVEEDALESALEHNEWTPRQRDQLLLALSHFDVIEGRDDLAFARLEELNTRQAGDYYAVLDRLKATGQSERFVAWLNWLLPTLTRAKQEDFNRICNYWAEAAGTLIPDESWVDILRSLLPRSYTYYTDYLIKNGHYRDWVDLQLSIRISSADLYSLDIRRMQDAHPDLLIPLYHQTIDRLVGEKNRNAYRESVRLLKKLRTCYKQTGKMERWEQYIDRMADKYNRLRAFQEELQKGKLLP